MMRTYTNRTEGLMPIGARPCAPMHGWSAPSVTFVPAFKQRFDAKTTGTANAHRLQGAPT
jgi:hypothetical protein